VGRTTLYRALGRARAVSIGDSKAKTASKARAPGRKPRAATATVAAGRV